jgi:hypothetical protein
LGELIKITKNDKKNVVFFATHSNFMIDKGDLSRNYKVLKTHDRTTISGFKKQQASYSSINYEVYGIATNDYHNELYGALQEKTECFLEKEFEEILEKSGVQKSQPYTKVHKDGNTSSYNVTLPTKIRNVIHHPENPNNTFSVQELFKSIEMLKPLLTGPKLTTKK